MGDSCGGLAAEFVVVSVLSMEDGKKAFFFIVFRNNLFCSELSQQADIIILVRSFLPSGSKERFDYYLFILTHACTYIHTSY
jgi:hypothetical protein